MIPSAKAWARFCLWLLPPVWLGFLYGLWQRRAGLPLVHRMALCGLAGGAGALVLGLLLSGIVAAPPSVPASSVFVDTGVLTATGTGIITATLPAWTCPGGARLTVTPTLTGLSCESVPAPRPQGPPGRE